MELPEAGDVLLDKYRLDEVLGEGGFGIVYLGTTLGSGRRVAVKVLKPGDEGYQSNRAERFWLELRTIASLQNPHTLTMYDYGRTADGVMFMVAEYVEGIDLDQLLKQHGRLSEVETVHVLLQVLDSLREAHAADVLHRDIKPSNIRIFEYAGDPLRAKLLDFGLAKSLEAGEQKLTEAGKIVGTPRFMSPEQLRGKELGPATDIYSLGLVAIEMLLGPKSGRLRTATRRPALSVGDRVTRQLRVVINKMVARHRRDRYDRAGDLLDDLRPIQRAAIHAGQGLSPELAKLTSAPQRPDEEERATAVTVEDVATPTALLDALQQTVEQDRRADTAQTLESTPPTGSPERESRPRPLEDDRPREEPPRREKSQEGLSRWVVWVAGFLIVLTAVAMVGAAAVVLTADRSPQVAVPRPSPRAGPRGIPEPKVTSPGCGKLSPHRGARGVVDRDLMTLLVVPRGYDPFGNHPLLLVFWQNRYVDYPSAEQLEALATDHGAVLATVTSDQDAAEVLAFVANRLCVDLNEVFALGVAGASRRLVSERCDLGLRAFATMNWRGEPKPRCGDPPAYLNIAPPSFEARFEQPDATRTAWLDEYECPTDPSFGMQSRGVCAAPKCDNGAYVECRLVSTKANGGSPMLMEFFERFGMTRRDQ